MRVAVAREVTTLPISRDLARLVFNVLRRYTHTVDYFVTKIPGNDFELELEF